ncbi:RNA polymerase sigma factor SigM [Sedimentisphaera cyanobacteriorum]|uniref:RNA polymerase sigma factor SigM n=1 Tax=Sedimentisphaera cyanobacteriorum TaxID=1940790 RepID=A0A1Q2HNA3_9BACT|nr:sigma-70 family RNA polymerase sigma factor [Sedimentisphaera cyanobacteriorum]AQQ08840.1 RNA polymerase sigma factor SigM [Sedimentisphaera cyanobacteriorum]
MKIKKENSDFIKHYSRVQLRLYTYLLASVHNRNDADELMQEVSLILWESFDKYDPSYDFAGWALGIAKNKVKEHMRSRKRAPVFGENFYESLVQLAQYSDDNQAERIELLQKCIKKLNTSDRKLLLMRFKKEFSVKKISEITGRSGNGIYKSLARIVALLRSCIKRELLRQE